MNKAVPIELFSHGQIIIPLYEIGDLILGHYGYKPPLEILI